MKRNWKKLVLIVGVVADGPRRGGSARLSQDQIDTLREWATANSSGDKASAGH